ncbi:poly(3-hydroxyalkanoate) depolymerase [Rhodococcus olei]|uniref:Poly(3-hydroxyalkanoate) depolymerase n=1 Tax=Rhodococcus olei TaxID=2161675 RepID=A0ABP8P1D8_9NOCA
MTGEVTHMVTVGGHRLRVRVRPGDSVPLVLCNGIGAGLEVLEPVVEHLDPGRTVVRFDVPGTGGSPASFLPHGFPYLARMLGRLLDDLGYGTVDVLGYSWGGGLAQQFAFRNPRRCRRLVLVATATGALMVPAAPAVLAKMVTPRRFADPDHLAANAATIYGGSARRGDPGLDRIVGHQAVSRRGYLYQLLAGAAWTSLFALPVIRQPTLVVAGTDDPLIPLVNARIMHRLLPNATLELHSGGHIELLTNAPALASVVDGFLGAPSQTRPT